MLRSTRKVWFWLRLLVYLSMLGLVLIFFHRYDLTTLPAGQLQMGGGLRPHAWLVLCQVGPSTPLGVGTLVEAVVATKTGPRRLFSRIAGLPGQRLDLRPGPGGTWELFIDGKSSWSLIHGPSALHAGVIPKDHFLLLNPVPDAPAPDSRQLGLLTRANLKRKILHVF